MAILLPVDREKERAVTILNDEVSPTVRSVPPKPDLTHQRDRTPCSTYIVTTSLLLVALVAHHANAMESREQDGRGASSGALSDDGLANLAAFTQAFGLLRFFHPSDQGNSEAWDGLAVRGAQNLERARSSRELARGLRELFAPVAPSAQFLVTGEPVERLQPPSGATQIGRWRHHGLGFGQPPRLAQIYFSEREFLPASPQPNDWASPAEPLVADLGRGVRLALPLVLWADAAGKTFPMAPPPKMEETAKVSVAGGSRERSIRFAAVAVGWTAVRYFFPYFGDVAVNWDAELATALKRAATDRTKEDLLLTLQRMMAALGDGHAGAYLDDAPPEAAPPVALTMVGGEAVVVKAWGDAAASLPVGSVILFIDGQDISTRIARTAAQLSAATPGWLDTCVARDLLAGTPGSTVSVVARPPGAKERKVALARLPASGDSTPRPTSPAVREVQEGVWYVSLSKIPQAELDALYPKLANAKAVIFDLRWYPQVDPSLLQHLTDKPVMSAKWEIPVVTGPTREAISWDTTLGRWELEPLAPRIKGKVAFLTGGATISYGESLLGIVDAYKLGVIVGAPSAGTNGTVVETKLPGGVSISWTGMRVRRHDGGRLFGLGIQPTIMAKPTIGGLAADRDEVLEAAIDAVGK